MFDSLPRRKRLVVITAAAAVAFAAVTAIVLVMGLAGDETYRPGDAVAGLTAALARDLPPDYPRVAFEDVSVPAGITFRHFRGVRSSQLPEDMGSGAAWGDFDNDGWQDLFLVNFAGPLTMSDDARRASGATTALYRNNGDGTFSDVAAAAGVALRINGMGAEWADMDNDGFLDLFVTAYGHNVLFRNNGNGTFSDATETAGVRAPFGFWTGPAWGDYDRDGWVDLYVTGYVQYDPNHVRAVSKHYDVEEPASINPSSFPPMANLLYHNEGNGRFTELAVPTGVANPEGRGLEASWTDFDDDGWPDLYLANDVSDNVLYRNLGNGSFVDVSHAARVADYRGAMGIAVGDWDGDTDMDMVVTHWIAQENALYTNKTADRRAASPGDGSQSMQFMDEADRYGLGQISLDYIGWGTAFFDADNDGRLDLWVTNGSTFQDRDDPRWLVPMPDQLFWNRSVREGFFNLSSVAGAYFTEEFVGRGTAFADYDNDGDVDVFILNHDGPGILLRNASDTIGNWLEVRLEGRVSNRSALGAKLRIVAGGTHQVREVGAQSSYLSQNSLVQHFGLGQALAVDTLEVRWPSGTRQTLLGLTGNALVTVVEATATP